MTVGGTYIWTEGKKVRRSNILTLLLKIAYKVTLGSKSVGELLWQDALGGWPLDAEHRIGFDHLQI